MLAFLVFLLFFIFQYQLVHSVPCSRSNIALVSSPEVREVAVKVHSLLSGTFSEENVHLNISNSQVREYANVHGFLSNGCHLLVLLLEAINRGNIEPLFVRIRKNHPDLPFVAMGMSAESTALHKLLLLKSTDFVLQPFDELRVVPRVRRFLSVVTERMSKSLEGAFASLVGKSENFLSAVDQVHIASRSDATILLLGETGTGKELAARAIHYGGPRSGRPFVPVHCGAVPDHLFENELFGHVKGAFTDASTPTKGLIEEAEGGTLFLDEVDTLTPAAQIKLLRFLQDGHYRPLGSSKDHVADVRVITASNSDLKALVESEKFRKDLFYRISSLAIELPPLRERPTDIPVLAMHFLRMFEQELGSIPRELSASAIQSLLIHYWPGNVRELRGMIHKAILMNQSGSLTARDFQFQGEKERQLSVFKEAKSDAVRRFEQEYVINLLRLHGGNLTLAADRAGTDRRVLQRLLQKHSLDRSEFASTA